MRFVETAASRGLGLLQRQVTNFVAGKFGWYRLLLAFGLREPLENAQAAAHQVRPLRDLHDLLAGQSRVMHFDGRRHPAVSGARASSSGARSPRRSGSRSGRRMIFFLGAAALSLAGFRMILLLIMIWIAARLIYRWKFEKQGRRAYAARLISSASAR